MIAKIAARLPFFYGWIVVGVVFVTMALCVNARTAFSLLFPPILDEFGWERGVTAGAFSFGFIVSAVLSPLLGKLMDRRESRFVMEIGIVATAAGMIATFSSEPWHVYATLGMLVGANTFTGDTGQALFLPNWFVRRRGLALSVAFAGVGFGSRDAPCAGCPLWVRSNAVAAQRSSPVLQTDFCSSRIVTNG